MSRVDALRPVIYMYNDTETNILSIYVLTYDTMVIFIESIKTPE